MKDFSANPPESSNQIRTEIIGLSELEKLPKGVCLLSNDPENSGSAALGGYILGLIRAETRVLPSHLLEEAKLRENSPQYLIGQLCANCENSVLSRRLLDSVDSAFPNLCWFRGGDYVETPAGAPALTEFPSFGANGLLGDSRAITYAQRNYNSATHRNPVLYVIRLKDLLTGMDQGSIQLGTEHDYDVVVAKKGDGYDQWALKSVIVVDLGNSAEDFDKAMRILRGKATTI